MTVQSDKEKKEWADFWNNSEKVDDLAISKESESDGE